MGTFIAMPILSKNVDFNIEKLKTKIKQLSGIKKTNIIKQEKDIINFLLDDIEINAISIPKPIQCDDLKRLCQSNVFWENSEDQIKSHKAHIIVCASGQFPFKILAWYLTKSIEVIISSVDSLGVYWGSGSLIIPKNEFIEMSSKSSLKYLPLYLWIDFHCYKEKLNCYSLFTTGMKSLGFMEIEILKSKKKPIELINKTFNIAHYLLDYGPIIKDGDTISISNNECFRIQYKESFVDKKEIVYNIEI